MRAPPIVTDFAAMPVSGKFLRRKKEAPQAAPFFDAAEPIAQFSGTFLPSL